VVSITLANLCLFIIVCLFTLYGILVAFDCGTAFFILWPGLLSKKKEKTRQHDIFHGFTKYIFLLFGFFGFKILFNTAWTLAFNKVITLILIGVIAILLNSVMFIILKNNKHHRHDGLLYKLKAICIFLAPLSFAGVGVYLLTGNPFWATTAGGLLMLSSLIGLTSIGVAYVMRHMKQKQYQWLPLVLFSMWGFVLGFLVPIVLIRSHSSLATTSLALLTLSVALIMLGYLFTFVVLKQYDQTWQFNLLIGGIAPVLLVWANWPYIINNQIGINQAISVHSNAAALIMYIILLLPIISYGYLIFTTSISKNKVSKEA